MRIQILGSGSRGNACIIRTTESLFLLDNGFSGKELVRRLDAVQMDPRDIQGILVSHDHADHIRGVGVFARRYHTPVFLNRLTFESTRRTFANTAVEFFPTGQTVTIRDLQVETFSLPHDAGDPVGFTFSQVSPDNHSPGKKAGFITDLGQVTPLIRQKLRDIQALIIESNHDEEMLMRGPYPWSLKQRLRGRTGHLSNFAAAGLISDVVRQTGITEVTLAHLSEQNNDPALAAETVLEQVEQNCGTTIDVRIASQKEPIDELML
ncbi:MAG TPA: MBL fold metallo-hydrolase [bacterium]|nr:MBL fold metallo-hydrolase [bacterium]